MSSQSNTKVFTLASILAVLKSCVKMFSNEDESIEKMTELMNFMTQAKIDKKNAPLFLAMIHKCGDEILRQHPHLSAIKESIVCGECKDWINNNQKILKETLPIEPFADPISEEELIGISELGKLIGFFL